MFRESFNNKLILNLVEEINLSQKKKNFFYVSHYITNRHLIIKTENKTKKNFSIRFLINEKDNTNYFGFKFSILNEKKAYEVLSKISLAPKVIFFGKSSLISKNYLITEWINGKNLYDELKKNKKNDIKKIGIKLINRILDIKEKKLKFKKSINSISIKSLKKDIIKKIESKTFIKYYKNIKVLKNEIQNYNFLETEKCYVCYDQHPKNIIVKGKKYFFFDFDYFHYGYIESEFITIFLDLIAAFSKNKMKDIDFLRSYLKKKNIKLENEYFFLLTHYINAILKHETKIEKNAKTKINIYVKAIKKMLNDKKKIYPKIKWN